ncbi:hypothetical protein [Miltoncostaea oceani]|uniref:hypothetical protein n=1 Tax=Miltoncostaea oceani TaxID=2843216 RepID=UPI001C3CACE9|nr:hypothetical protein [Miltoncostaea oceani]
MAQQASVSPIAVLTESGDGTLRERLAAADQSTVVNFNVRMRPPLHEALQVIQTRLRLSGVRCNRVDLVELALLELLETPIEELPQRLAGFPARGEER